MQNTRRVINSILNEAYTPTSESFKRWFAGSKVVDPDGNPQPMYHGTSADTDFEEFWTSGPQYPDDVEDIDIISSIGAGDPNVYLGAHFTGSPGAASKVAGGDLDWQITRDRGGTRARVIPVFLSIKNPYEAHSEEDLTRVIVNGAAHENVSFSVDPVEEYAENKFDDPEEFYDRYDEDVEFRSKVLYDILVNLNSITEYWEPGLDEEIMDEFGSAAKVFLVKQGYDGVAYPNEVEFGGYSWIAFHPEQIKSAYASEFNPDSPRYSE